METSERIHTTTAELYRFNEEVLVIKFKTDVLVDLENAIEVDEALMKLANNRPHYFIIHAIGITSNMKPDALKYFARGSQISEFTKRSGILLDNLPIRLTASAFIKFFKPVYPVKIFSTQEGALEWFEKSED